VIVARNFFPQSFFVQLSVEVSAALSRIENASSHLSRSPFRYENLQNSVRAQDDVYLFERINYYHACIISETFLDHSFSYLLIGSFNP
jgi:hypothetical protein